MNSDSSPIAIKKQRCDYLHNPIGIDNLVPRLSWQFEAKQRNMRQNAFHILVADSLASLAKNDGNCWDSGVVSSNLTTHIPYGGAPLESRKRYYWKVQAWDEQNKPSAWSEVAYWEMGLLDKAEWQAEWIVPDSEKEPLAVQPPPYLRKTFSADADVLSARIYVTALGCYELHLDGQRVGEDYFTPGWTTYEKLLQYQVYDVTAVLTSGEHTIGAMLSDGWFRGHLPKGSNHYGDRLALRLQLEVVYKDGRIQTINTDSSWQSTTGPILAADHYMGEHYDARLEMEGWATPTFKATDWAGVSVDRSLDYNLIAQIGTPVRKKQEIKPIELITTPEGDKVIDFGQNFVGWLRLKVCGEAGTAVTLHHAEVLDPDGNFYTENLRKADQKVTYICRGDRHPEVYEPHFTFQGFRYVKVEGIPDGQLSLETLTGVVLYSDLEATGHFDCSNPMINQLQQNIVWGQRGNFLEVPTDCPQRDERLGWTGDAQVFVSTACFNMDVAAFFERWMANMRVDQRQDGALPFVSPNVLEKHAFGATGWADAGVIVPWVLYTHYGDTQILADNYELMQGWISFMQSRAGDNLLWEGDFHFGDWLSNEFPDLNTRFGFTNTDLIANAFFAYSASLMAKIAAILDKPADAAHYAELTGKIKVAFCNEYVSPNGRLSSHTQTAYVLALTFDMLPDDLRQTAVDRLVADIESRDMHLSTGFLGTPYLCHALSENGRLDIAYNLLLQETFPGWLYPIKHGATTIWERWDGIRPDGTFQLASMNSFNHYAYGAIGDWLYKVVAGLAVDEAQPGFKNAVIHPHPGGNLTHATAELETVNGRFRTHWQIDEDDFILETAVPPNCTATVILPTHTTDNVFEGDTPLEEAVVDLKPNHDIVSFSVGSGQYTFKFPQKNLQIG